MNIDEQEIMLEKDVTLICRTCSPAFCHRRIPMKLKMKNKVIAFAMSLAMVFTMIPMMGAPAYADDPAPPAPGIAVGPDVLSVGSNTNGAATVHMAGTKWRVIGYGDGSMRLLAADNLQTGVRFNENLGAANANDYKDSNLQKTVDGLYENQFSVGEKSAVIERTLEVGEFANSHPYSTGVSGTVTTGYLWPLSTAEALELNTPESFKLLEASDYWWLRSPGIDDYEVACVFSDGAVSYFGDTVGPSNGVRPAFDLNLNSVLFTSAAVGGKSSGAEGAGALKPVGSNSTNDWKLTLQSGHEGFKITSSSYDNTNHVLTVDYSGAVTSPDGNEYVSAVVVDKDGKITNYGNIKQCKSDGDASGQIEINLEGKLSCRNASDIYVFNEQLNGNNKTDYSSPLTKITVPATAEHNYLWAYIDDVNHKGVCNVCGEEITENHTYNKGRCTVCNGACGHSSLNDSYSHDLYIHWKTCAYCGNAIEHEEHAWQDEWTADGTKHWHECEVCHTKKDEAAHTMSTEWSTDGDNHWHECIACGERKDEAAHTMSTKWSTDGDNHWHECTACGEKKDEAAHIEEIDQAVSPTCADPGKTEGKHCSECELVLNAQEPIDALGHKYGAWTKLNATQHQKVCQHDKSHVVKENHKWDAGKVTKKATEKATGVKTYTCTVCKATKTETIPKLKPSAPKTSGTPLAKATVKNKSMTIGWNKIQGAEGYDIFFATCNHSGKKIACKNVKTIKGNKTFKWIKSGLKKGTAYKFYVRAYVTKNGKKTYVSKTPMFHAYTGNGTKNYTNAKSVTVNKTKVTLKKGKTFKIKAKVNKVKKNKKLMPKSHAATLRYMTSNKKVATVNSSGKITAKGKGSCVVYVYAHNGVSKQVKVTVK